MKYKFLRAESYKQKTRKASNKQRKAVLLSKRTKIERNKKKPTLQNTTQKH